MEFSAFDTRNYPTLHAQEGYAEWAASYEDTVLDLMDLRLLARLRTVEWQNAKRVVDLACGTGRIGVWLKRRGVGTLDGIDVTAAMLAKAKAKNVYDHLVQGDIAATGFDSGVYDLVPRFSPTNTLLTSNRSIARPRG
jgi:predicted TPR repeat methyltransferase